MAKVRDSLYIEDGISENDIDNAIKQLGLEKDTDFIALMEKQQHELAEF